MNKLMLQCIDREDKGLQRTSTSDQVHARFKNSIRSGVGAHNTLRLNDLEKETFRTQRAICEQLIDTASTLVLSYLHIFIYWNVERCNWNHRKMQTRIAEDNTPIILYSLEILFYLTSLPLSEYMDGKKQEKQPQ